MKRIFHTKLSEYLEHYNLLTSNQYGFPKSKSTLDSIALFTKDVLQAINEGYRTVAVFEDTKKACDTVCHTTLIEKMKPLGLHQDNLPWIS